MIPIGASISTAAAVLVGGLVLGAVLISPQPAAPQTVWFDQPDNYAIVAAGGAVIAMHASTDRKITQFRLVITRDHEVVTVLNDTTPDSVFFGVSASPLVSGSTQWKAEPGEYRLTPSYLTGAGWTSGVTVRVTVPDGTVVLPHGFDPIAPPVQPDDPAEEPTEPVDPAQPLPEEPTAPAVPQPTTAPPSSAPTSAPTTPPATPATPPAGTVRRSVSGSTTKFVAEAVQPQSAYVDVQVQLTSGYNTASQPNGTWTSVGCGNLTAQPGTSPTKYTCTTAAWTPGSQSSGFRTAHVRVVVTSGGQTSTSYGADWLIDPQIN